MVTGSVSSSDPFSDMSVGSSISCLPTLYRRPERLVLEEERGVVVAQMRPSQVHAAVHQEGLPRDIARQVGQQKQDGPGDFVRAAASPHRDGTTVTVRVL